MEKEEKREKRRKLNSKGFSLVELIIVIAIIAILAGVLSPQLIKYINKSKKSADIQTAQTLATAVSAALADEKAFDAADSTTISACYGADADTSVFQKEIKSIVGATAPVPKYDSSTYKDFYIEVNPSDKSFTIYAGTKAQAEANKNGLILYPTIGSIYE